MARIRTIKPEFPQSESMGRVSRDARLLFIQLWTLCDDSGRTRGNSRMLASLLFPYDDDATGLIDGWLVELEEEGCIIRYQIDSATYLQVANWLNHQKIDKPSASKIPPFVESSRILSNDLEPSPLDQGSRIKDQGEERDQEKDAEKEQSQQAAPPVRKKKSDLTYQQFKDKCLAEGVKEMPADHPVFDYADKTGIDTDWLRIAYFEFTSKDPSKKYKDWRLAFLNCVKGNWMRLWYVGQDGKPALTTQGILAMKNYQERLNENG